MLLLCGAYARAQKHYARLPLFVWLPSAVQPPTHRQAQCRWGRSVAPAPRAPRARRLRRDQRRGRRKWRSRRTTSKSSARARRRRRRRALRLSTASPALPLSVCGEAAAQKTTGSAATRRLSGSDGVLHHLLLDVHPVRYTLALPKVTPCDGRASAIVHCGCRSWRSPQRRGPPQTAPSCPNDANSTERNGANYAFSTGNI